MTTIFKHIRPSGFVVKGDGSIGFGVDNKGGVTIAFRIIKEDKDAGKIDIELGASQCSFEDNFCRATGRRISEQRLNENPIAVSLDCTYQNLFKDNANAMPIGLAVTESIFGAEEAAKHAAMYAEMQEDED